MASHRAFIFCTYCPPPPQKKPPNLNCFFSNPAVIATPSKSAESAEDGEATEASEPTSPREEKEGEEEEGPRQDRLRSRVLLRKGRVVHVSDPMTELNNEQRIKIMMAVKVASEPYSPIDGRRTTR